MMEGSGISDTRVVLPWTDVEANDPQFVAEKMLLWQSSFWEWYCDNVWTIDEADMSAPIKKAPQFRYLKEQYEIEEDSKVLVVIKSRRMFQSHFQYARILYNFLFVPFSKNLIISKKENDVKEGLRHRILAMHERLDKRFPCHVCLKPRKDIHELEIMHPDKAIGSHILGLPSGSDQIRSYTATRVFVDESAFHEKKDQIETFAALKPAIEGPSGKAIIVSTPKPDTKFEELTTQLNPDVPMEHIMEGLDLASNKFNHKVLFLRYLADPKKRTEEWFFKEKFGTTVDGIPIPGASGVDEYDWRREYELSFDYPLGTPVVQEFKRDIHCVPYAKYGEYMEDKPLEVGIDFGSRFPAVVFMQVDSLNRLIVHDGIMPYDENLDVFLPRIDRYIHEHFPDVCKINIYCDPAGSARSGQGTAPPATEAIYQHFKIVAKYKPSKPKDRARVIRKLAGKIIGPAPSLIVNPHAGIYINSAERKEITGVIPKALEIGWVYDSDKPGQLEPLKDDFHDHLMDAMGYAVTFLYPNLFSEEARKRVERKPKKKKTLRR